MRSHTHNRYNDVFGKKVELLWEKLSECKDTKQLEDFASVCGRYAAFISICNTKEQAHVFRASAPTPEEAWEKARSKAVKFVSNKGFDPVWIKADITFKGEVRPFKDVIAQIAKCRKQFFRRGIAFDRNLETALLEAELNGRYLLNYKKRAFELPVLNKFFASCELKTLIQFPDEVVLFDCRSFFCDENNNIYELYSEGNDCGRRIIDRFDKDTAHDVILSSAEQLVKQIDNNGKFNYGVFAVFNQQIPGYNILRHTSTLWCLLCAYRMTNDKDILHRVESAIDYMLSDTVYKEPKSDNNVLYLIDKNVNEIKIGSNAVAVIMLTEYMDIVGTNKYEKTAVEFGNAILELMESDGSFFHVLSYPSMEPKDRNRIVYYDGEAVFALCRLYGLTKQQRFLDAAKLAVDRFIRDDYVKYADHWVSYSMNEITKYLPEERYFSFAMRNVQENLNKIYKQDTTFHTYLEVLCASFETYSRIKEQGIECGYMSELDEEFFIKTIFHRADYMLNGYGYPEYAMYMKKPESVLGSFFVRHHDFRSRIDDVQHFCGAYYSLYRNYEKLDALRESMTEDRDV